MATWAEMTADLFPEHPPDEKSRPAGQQGDSQNINQDQDNTGWSKREQELRQRVLDGETVVADVHKGKMDHLIEWAKAEDLFVYIGRAMPRLKIEASDWANPFTGDRDKAIAAYEHEHLDQRPDLIERLPELRGKVLGCWCAPLACHGDVLARLAGAVGAVPVAVEPFGSSAENYVAAGWPPIPIMPAEGGKGTPLKGTTGWEGVDLTSEQIEEQRQEHAGNNVAIRCPVGVIGLDVDHYDEKTGGDTLKEWADDWGELPPTYVSTSRTDGISGIRWFRVPDDWIGVGGAPSIELIQRHHRFALVAPSLHPSGRVYRWLAQDGLPKVEIPRVEDLPELPAKYLDGLKRTGGGNGDRAEVDQETLALVLTGREPCPAVDRALLVYPTETKAGKACHDTMLKVQLALMRLGEQGHHGVKVAMEVLREVFEEDRGDVRDTEKEWTDALVTGLEKVMANPTAEADRRCCSGVKAGRWLDERGGILTEDVTTALIERHPMRLALGERVAIYRDGVYRPDELLIVGVLQEMLGNDYRSGHFTTVHQALKGKLALARSYLKVRLDRPLTNVQNGWIELDTGELLDHTPELETSIQLPIEYDPDAVCPTFDAWLEDMAGGQAQALLEAASEMLDLSAKLKKALLLFGPSKSGKSTFLRLLEAIAGAENRSSVTLHTLADDKFAAARIHGKILNVAADLSARHVEDLSVFKALTGGDAIDANRKYGKEFNYTNLALLAFSTNEIPSVSDSSSAYSNRMSVFKFGKSFANHEDPSIETAMLKELPGILNRLAQAWKARHERGEDLPQDPTTRQEFEEASDRVTQWVHEEMIVLREWAGEKVYAYMQLPEEASAETSDAKSLRTQFNAWAEPNGFGTMGRNTLVKRLTSKNGVLRVRIGETRKERFAIRHRREDEDPEAPEAFGPSKDPGESEDDPASEGGAGVGVAQDREKASEASAEAKKPPPSPKASGGVGSADPHAKARARLKAAKAAGS